MLVDIGFPEPVIEDRSEHIKSIIEELRTAVNNLKAGETAMLSCPLERDNKYSLYAYEVDWLRGYFSRYGWNLSYLPDGRAKTVTVSLSASKDFLDKKLKERLCSLT
jgi:hypothetical protein